jgi:hypothetical protein
MHITTLGIDVAKGEKKRYRESFLGQAPSRISPGRGAIAYHSVSINLLPCHRCS